jgi:hypothetical protein
MKCVIVLLLVVVATAYAGYAVEPYHHHYVPGFQHTYNGIVSAYRNDLRQIGVNNVAEHVGSGIGTGRFYGVPGTNGHYDNYGYGHGYGHGGYGHGGYGHGGYGHDRGYAVRDGYGYGGH